MHHSHTPLKIGDLLMREKDLFFDHVGVWAGNGAVFHNSPGKGECFDTLDAFAAGRTVRVRPTAIPEHLAAQRIRERLASPRPYHPIDSNCDHSANAVAHGVSFSPQLRFAVFLLLVVGLIVAGRTRD